MQAERQPAPRYGRWQALWFGLPLGALAFGVLLLAVIPPSHLSAGQAIFLGLTLYFAIAFVAGYRYCSQRRHEGWESGWAGFLTGLVAATLFLLVTLVLLIIAIHVDDVAPPPQPPSRTFHSNSFDVLISTLIFGVLALLNGVGVLLSAIGGRIGGALAVWRTAPRISPPEAQEASVE